MMSARPSNQQIKRDIIASLPVIVLASLLTIGMDCLGWLSGFENATTNIFQQRRLKPDNVFLVAIDEGDYGKLFQKVSPLDPGVLGDIIAAIAAGKPRAVVVDLDTADAKFGQLKQLKTDVPIIWAATPTASTTGGGELDRLSLAAVGTAIAASNQVIGASRFPRDADNVVRRYDRMVPLLEHGEQKSFPSLPFRLIETVGQPVDRSDLNQVILRFLDTSESPVDSLDSSDKTIESELSSSTVLGFFREKKTDGWRAMLAGRDGKPGKVVVLGGTFRAGRNTLLTPVGPLPGSIVAASAIETEMDHAGIFQPDIWMVFLLQISAGVLFAYISFRFAETIVPLASLIVIPLSAFLLSLLSFWSLKLWIDFIPALVVLQLFYSYLHIGRVRKRNADLLKLNTELINTRDELGRALESGAEQERKRVTVEIHDETQDYFSMVKAMVKPLADAGDSRAKRAFDAVSDGLIGLRRIMSNLYPPEFDNENATFLFLINELARRRSTQLPTEVRDQTDKAIDQLSRKNWFPVYRIVQQALSNAFTHAEPSRAQITITNLDGAFIITISDDGKGLPEGGIEKMKRSGSYGVDGMKARAELIKGALDWVSPSKYLDKGTDVVLTIPPQVVVPVEPQ